MIRRTLRTASTAAQLLLCSTALCQAVPIIGAIGAFAGWLGGGGILAGLVGGALKLGIGLGISYLAQSIFGKKQPVGGTGGASGTMQSGGAVSRSFIIGRAMTAGSLVYRGTWGQDDGTPNAYYHRVISLSDLPVKGLAEVWVNGSKVTWDPSTPSGTQRAIPEYNNDGDRLWIRFYDGEQTTADAQMVSRFAGSARPWKATRVGTGVAYAVIIARVSDKVFSGFPQFKFVLDGVPLYDVRKDSAMGGSGVQTWGDPSTYSPAPANLAVQAYNVIRGITYKGKYFFGGQTVSGPQLPISSWSAAMNECDLSVPLVGGGTEAQYRGGGEISLDTDPADVVAEMMKGCNGRLAEVGGVYKPHVGAPSTSVFSFTDETILSTDPQTFEPFPSLAEVINAVTGKYIEPGEGWSAKDAPPLYSLALEAADDGRRQVADVTYGLVTSGTQVQRLMKSALAEARRFRQHALPMPPDAFLLEPNDFVSWTSARNGYVTKLFRADAVQDLGNLNIGLNLTEVDPADYLWIPGDDERPVITAPTEVIRPPAQPIIDWNAVPITIRGDGDSMRAGIRMSWDPNIDDVDGVQFEVRLAVDQTMVLQSETDRVDAGAIEISQSILGLTQYEVRGRYRPASPRPAAWSSWRAVLTPDIAEGLTQQQRYELALMTNDAQGSMQALQDQMRELIEQVAHTSAEEAGQGFLQRQEIRQSVIAFSGNISAAIMRVTTAFVEGDAALASDLVALTAVSDENQAAILSESTARADADDALASMVTAVQAIADQGTAGGFIKFEAVSAPSGVTARFQIFLNVGTSGTPSWKDAGFMLEIVGGVARCVIKADQFVLGDATTGVIPFSIVAGILYARHLVLQSSNDVVKLDLSNDALIFSEP
ncbi:phage tail protein [Kaistia terrae]|uniref:Phage tail protein n=1 Tax=Kaistia terrae TaxID=537017 RepID=A0ABW0Q4W7_9HYPH|nr:phage tail protein [Kaistia terrae]MCX5581317.1 phage tail protein [Kaistia terrae]